MCDTKRGMIKTMEKIRLRDLSWILKLAILGELIHLILFVGGFFYAISGGSL